MRPRPVTVPLLAALALCGALSACAPLYLPPVPEERDIAVPERLELSAELRQSAQQRLELHLTFARIPEAGWLAVQWFSPAGREVASDALWLEPGDVGLEPLLALADQPLTPGLWRAVLSFGGTLVRQVSLEIGAE